MLIICLKKSRLLAAWLLCVHLAAATAVLVAGLPVAAGLALLAAILFSVCAHVYLGMWPGTRRVTSVALDPGGAGELEIGGRAFSVRWLPGGWRVTGIHLLQFSQPGQSRKHRVLILPDMASFEDRCRLRGFVARLEADQRNILG